MTALIRAELQKLFTTRLWWVLLLVMLLLIALFLGFAIAFAGVTQNGAAGLPARDTPQWAQLAWGSGSSGTILVTILGVVMMTAEYRYQTITGTFLTTPRRFPVVAAKLLAGVIAGLLFGVAVLLLEAVTVIPAVILSGGTFSPSASHLPQTTVGLLAAFALYALFGIGLGALVRNQVAAIVGAVVWTYVIEQILTAIPVLQPVGRWLPAGAAQALMRMDLDTGLGRPDLLPAWGGALVLAGYALLFAAVASATTVRRDIT
ncbi:ABC transporter permease [Microbispora sp. ATCC PTA-5024]|uniref:ABC transporter permease n=1 Tax=Microbispora sp. ATCC PTA-5024 TaxID=316330 RepID=UPI000425166E|nr:ABC transporter permease [Microbispora sp. ATCC PTA-5024]